MTLTRLSVLLVFVAILFAQRPAFAHVIGLSRGTYIVDPNGVDVELTFAASDFAALVTSDDAIARELLSRVPITRGDSACVPQLKGRTKAEQDGIVVTARYECAAAALRTRVDDAFVRDLPAGHRHLAHAIAGAATLDALCTGTETRFDVVGPEAVVASPFPWTRFVAMGIEHILGGYDHILFLFALILVGGRVRSIVLVVTAFTVAHALTLALATFDLVAIAPRIVEPAIALSIAYVGAENFFVHDVEKRWRIAFLFGLVHGFGFAGALRALGLAHPEIPKALVFFNVGIEIGQLGVLLILLPLVFAARRSGWFARARVTYVVSALIVVVGVVLFVVRVRTDF